MAGGMEGQMIDGGVGRRDGWINGALCHRRWFDAGDFQ